VWGSNSQDIFSSLFLALPILRLAHDWEMDHFTLLFTLLYSVRVRQGVEDRLSWIPSKKWSFDVKSDYKVLVPYAFIFFGQVFGGIGLP
jgi:hypothetical protein